MPIIKIENGYVFRKTTKKVGISKAFLIFLVFIISICILTGSMLLFSKYDVTSALKLNKYQVFSAKTYFGVSVKNGNSYSDVSADINAIKLQDGAGAVIKNNDFYYLLTSIYDSKEDAESVVSKIKGYDADITQIELPSLVISVSFSTEQIKWLRMILNLANENFITLSDICNSLDRGEIMDAEAKQKLQIFSESCQEQRESFANVFQNHTENIIIRAKIFVSNLISNLSQLAVSQNLSSNIKYCNIMTIESFC